MLALSPHRKKALGLDPQAGRGLSVSGLIVLPVFSGRSGLLPWSHEHLHVRCKLAVGVSVNGCLSLWVKSGVDC